MRFTPKQFARPVAVFASFTALLVALPASAAALTPAVQGGQSATQGQAPWSSVALVVGNDSQGEFVCSGSVVAPDVVLTAGHCAVDANSNQVDAASGYTVMTGSAAWEPDGAPSDSTPFQAGPGGVLSGVSDVVAEPDFTYTGDGLADHDVALLQLSTPSTAPVIRLATSADSGLYGAGSTVQIGGWGITSPSAESIPQYLQYASSVLQSQLWCEDEAGSDFDSTDQICIHDTAAVGACEGDSGGPVLASTNGEYVEIGTTSWGPASSCNTTFDANLSALSSWLDQEIGVLSPLGATTNPASAVKQTTTTLNGSLTQVGSDASYYFEYGKTTSYGRVTQATSTSGDSYASANITNLSANATYHYRLVVTGTNRPAVYGADQVFTTRKPAVSKSSKATAAGHPRAGTYRGATGRYDRISLKIAGGKLSAITLHVGMRCTRARHVITFKLAARGAHALTVDRGLGFSHNFTRGRDLHYRLAARFTAAGTAVGTIKATATHQSQGSCHSGTIHWTARV